MELSSTQPGFFQIYLSVVARSSHWYFQANCPCGCDSPVVIPINMKGETKQSGSHCWDWDADLERPTLSPSLKRMNGCGCHFNLNAGIYTVHPDGAPMAPNCYRAV